MRNFINLKEVLFEENSKKPDYYINSIKPSIIDLLEPVLLKNINATKVHFAIGAQKFHFYAKETPEEIDELITNFYRQKKESGRRKTKVSQISEEE